MNRLLKRQLKKYLAEGDRIPPRIKPLIDAVSRAYDGFDEDRQLIERSLELSSLEFRKLNKQIAYERDLTQKYLNIAEVIIVALDIKGRVTMINEKGCKILGYHQKEIVGKNWFDNFIPKKIKKEIKTVFTRLIRGEIEPVKYFENPVVTRKGQERVIEWHNAILRDSQDRIIGTLGSGLDITERKQAEEALKESEKKYSTLIQSIPDVVYSSLPTKTGTILFISDKWKDWTGYSPKQCYKDPEVWVKSMHPGDVDRVVKSYVKDYKLKREHLSEYRIVNRKTSQLRWVIDHAVPVFGENNQVIRYDGTVTDITSLKQSQNNLEKLTECFLKLGPNSQKNIQILAQTAGELLGGACMRYNRLEKEQNLLCTWAIWNEPAEYKAFDNPKGYICYDVIKKNKPGKACIIGDLSTSKYKKTDPNVKKYKLRSYLGYPVSLNGKVVGSFCLCDVKKREFTHQHIQILSLLAKAVEIEEERIQTTQAILKNEQLYKVFIDSTEDIVFVKDEKFRYIIVNKAYEKFFNRKEPEILGKTDYQLMDRSSATACRMSDKKALSVSYGISIAEEKINGKIYDVRKFRVRMSENKFGVGGYIRDITKEKASQHKIEQFNITMKNVFNNAPFGIYVVNEQGNIEYANPAILKMSGDTLEEFLNLNVFNLPTYKEKGIASQIQDVLKGKTFLLDNIEYVSHFGRKKTIRNFTGIPFEQENRKKALIFVEDITGFKKSQEKIKSHEIKLQNQAAKLDKALKGSLKSKKVLIKMLDENNKIRAQLENKINELKEKESMLVQAEKLASLGKLVSDMAHEVNNPLMVILGRAQLSLMDKIHNKHIEENLNIIADQCMRAKDIIQRLLTFSKPSKGEMKDVSVNDSLEYVIKIVEHQYNIAGINIERKYSNPAPHAFADEKQLQEVYMNLLKNAAEAIEKEGTIKIITSTEDKYARIDIEDTGHGIRKQYLNKIFDPFFTTKKQGTGLGLSVCYGLIKSHNGELKYKTQVGKGTTATILLPIKPGICIRN